MGDRRLRAMPGVLVVVLLTACTSATVGSPTSGSTSTTSTGGGATSQPREPDRYGAPRVDNPLDPTRFFTDPCAIIPPAQRPSLNLSGPGKPDTTGALGSRAPNCDWGGDQGVNLAFLKANRNGLADLYHSNATHSWAYWEETIVEGYPAVFHGAPDQRNSGNCKIAVGLNDTLAMSVVTGDRSGAPTCDRAKRIAAVAVKTIKEGR